MGLTMARDSGDLAVHLSSGMDKADKLRLGRGSQRAVRIRHADRQAHLRMLTDQTKWAVPCLLFNAPRTLRPR